jgi:hypothetical protein
MATKPLSAQEMYDTFAEARAAAGLEAAPIPKSLLGTNAQVFCAFRQSAEDVQARLGADSKALQALNRVKQLCRKTQSCSADARIESILNTLRELRVVCDRHAEQFQANSEATSVSELQDYLVSASTYSAEVGVVLDDLINGANRR